MADKAFFAKVQWWDARIVHVRCPFCTKIHKHNFGESYDNVDRVAHCDSNCQLPYSSYQLKYPFSQVFETTSYEIDKERKKYVAIDADPPRMGSDRLAQEFAKLTLDEKSDIAPKRWTDAVEMITINQADKVYQRLQGESGGVETLILKKIYYVQSMMLWFGDEDYIQEYLRCSSESQILLHGVDFQGNSALWLSARERFPGVVELLLNRGADVDFQNRDGRTPLMEAALWGRYENVKRLLRHGADKNLQDSDGFKAIHFADSFERNEEERYRLGGGVRQTYREVTYIANQARKMIFHLLEDAEDEMIPSSNSNFENHVFQKQSSGIIRFVAPIAEYAVKEELWKTIARLERGCKYPSISAMSGWGHEGTMTVVSGRFWTKEVFRIAEIIDYVIETHELDQDKPGNFNACHSEKQLIAYFINKHVFLEPEIRPPKTSRYNTDSQFSNEGGHLHQLANATPPIMLKKAVILINRPPCGDCVRFNEKVNKHLGLEFSLINRSSSVVR